MRKEQSETQELMQTNEKCLRISDNFTKYKSQF